MTPEQVVLVQDSWKRLQPVAHAAAALLYNRLFTLDPSLPLLFRGDIQEQGRKLMAMIGVAINALDRLEAIGPALQALGRRHAGYGVRDKHYSVVGDALIWTLAQKLGVAFTREVEDAWRGAYGMIVATMKQASTKVAA